MLDAINIFAISKEMDNPLNDYKDCLKVLMCDNPTVLCHFNECSNCSDDDKLIEIIEYAPKK